MAKGLFLMFPGHGHVNPTIGLVKELVDRGDEITYIVNNEFKDKIEKVGANFIGCDLKLSNIDEMAKQFLDINTAVLNEALKLNGEFDYLVVDPFIHVSSKIMKKFKIKKSISLRTSFAQNKEIFSSYSNLSSFDTDSINEEFSQVKSEYDVFAKEFGVTLPKEPIDILLGSNADLKLVFTSRYYQPYVEEFDSSFKFIGPSIVDRKELEDFKIENPDNKKVIFISLGTIANQNSEFYKDCLEGLGSRDDIIVVMSIGKRMNVGELGEIPENFRIYNYVPQLEVLKQTDLFITHGGMNSSSEGLYYGIPLVVVPQFADQFLVAKRVEKLGAGLALINNLSSNSIRETVNNVLLNNSFKENAKKIGKSLKESGGHIKAVQYIHDIIK